MSPTGVASGISRPQVIVVLSTISALVWAAVIVLSPYPLSQIFVPNLEEQTNLVLHTTKALQFVQVSWFEAPFLWLAYQFIDLYREGLIGAGGLWQVAVLPVVGSLAGPGVAFALGTGGSRSCVVMVLERLAAVKHVILHGRWVERRVVES